MSVKLYVAQHTNELTLEAVREVAADDNQGDLNMIVGLRLLTQHGITPEQCAGGVVIDQHDQMQLVNKKDLADMTEAAKLSLGRDKLNTMLLCRLKTEKESNANLQKEVAELKAQLQSGSNPVVSTKSKTVKKKPNKKSSKGREDSSTAPGQDDTSAEPSTQDTSLLLTEMPALEQDQEAIVSEEVPLVQPESVAPMTPVAPVTVDSPLQPSSPAPPKTLAEEVRDLRAEFTAKYAVLQGAFDDLLGRCEEQREAMEALTELVTSD